MSYDFEVGSWVVFEFVFVLILDFWIFIIVRSNFFLGVNNLFLRNVYGIKEGVRNGEINLGTINVMVFKKIINVYNDCLID